MDKRGSEPIYKGHYDVIVVGGGIAGISAAVASSRMGAKTLIIEKSVNLGGMATSGLISWYEPLCDGCGNQMITGIAEELIKLAVMYGLDNLPESWGGSKKDIKIHERYSSFYSPTIFSVVLDNYVLENDVEIRLDTLVTYPLMENNRCKGIVVESVNGREYFEAESVVDASGDASIMNRAGVPCVTGKNYLTYIAHFYNTDDAKKLMETKDTGIFRKWMNVGSDMNGNGHPQNQKMFSEYTAEEVTEFMLIGKKRLLKKIKEKGKNNFDILTIPQIPQYRTIRRIIGKNDFLAVHNLKYEDSIGDCGDFRPQKIGNHYQIPFSSMYNEKFKNLIAAGRIISAPQGDGWEVSRVIPVCAMTGEVAGKAAAISALKHITMDEIRKDYIEKIRCPKV